MEESDQPNGRTRHSDHRHAEGYESKWGRVRRLVDVANGSWQWNPGDQNSQVPCRYGGHGGHVVSQPVRVGDTVACYARVEKIGRTSMTIPVEAWVRRYRSGELVRVTRAVFTYVAVDAEGKPIPVNRPS